MTYQQRQLLPLQSNCQFTSTMMRICTLEQCSLPAISVSLPPTMPTISRSPIIWELSYGLLTGGWPIASNHTFLGCSSWANRRTFLAWL